MITVEQPSHADMLDRMLNEYAEVQAIRAAIQALGIVEQLCNQMSDYEDEAKPEELCARVEDLNNRRVAAEVRASYLADRVTKLEAKQTRLTVSPSSQTFAEAIDRAGLEAWEEKQKKEGEGKVE